jgi:ribokinase
VTAASRLAVVGAINVDLVVSGARLPRAGETIVGGSFARHHGGKGGNQAVAAARIGADVAMVGSVGDDPFGREALDALRGEGVDVADVAVVEASTGVALIVVDTSGENQIAVAPGANAVLTAASVGAALDRAAPAVVLASLEVPADAVGAAGRWCRAHGATFVLNPAPASPGARNLAASADVVTPNALELEAIAPLAPGVATVRTLGARGAEIVSGQVRIAIEAPIVDAVDSTGAGDCFNGVLAAGLAAGLDLERAARRAVAASALSVTRAGAREGMPTAAELEPAE